MKKITQTLLFSLFVVTFPLLCIQSNAQTQINNYCFNGSVFAMAKAPDGGTFVGGTFTNVAEYCGRAIKLDPSTTPSYNLNDLKFEEGGVAAIVAIPGGGWYLGGTFTKVGGIARQGLVRINADGSLHQFNVPTCVAAYSLVLDSSGKLYAAGYFSTSNAVVCINADGTIHHTYSGFNNSVSKIAVDAGGNLYAIGGFTSPRNRLAKFNSDGTLNAFNPLFNSFAQVSALALTGAGELLIGGSFTTVNGFTRNRFAKFNADGSLNDFAPVFNSSITDIAVDSQDNFFVSGAFTTINSMSRYYLAKFNSDGSLHEFDPMMNAMVYDLHLDDTGALHVGGSFTTVFNFAASRWYYAKFNPDGSLNPFNERLNNTVTTIGVDATGTIYISGLVSGVNAVTRNRLAKFNADGTLNSFSASIVGGTATVNALAVDGLGNVYAGGSFTTVSSQSRRNVVKFNPDLTLNAFNPITDTANTVRSMATDSANNVYMGGINHFRKYNAGGTQVFNSNEFAGVNSIVIDSQDNVFIGGGFVANSEWKNVAKINANGTASSLTMGFNGTVYKIALDSSGNIYAGGSFTQANGQPRTYLAKINPDGTLNPFNPVLTNEVRAIVVGPSGNLFIGGSFITVNGMQRSYFAKFNPDGTLNNFNQRGINVNAILVDGAKLHVAGGYREYQVYTDGDTTCDLSLSSPVPGQRCGSGTVALSITPSSGDVRWYDAPVNGNLVGTGTTFTTSVIAATTTFYAEAFEGDCVSFERTAVVATVLPACDSVVDLKLFVEGYFNDGVMTSVLANQGVGAADMTDVELLTVELRDGVSYDLVATTTAMLKTDGSLACVYPTGPSGSFYIAVKGSNQIQTWSANPLPVGTTVLEYDFTTSADKAYGNNMIELQPGVFGFYSGDINQDEAIDLSDAVDIVNDAVNSAYGVLATDLNGDGAVDNSDIPFLVNNSENSIFCHRPN